MLHCTALQAVLVFVSVFCLDLVHNKHYITTTTTRRLKLPVTSYQLRTTSYELPATNYQLRTTRLPDIYYLLSTNKKLPVAVIYEQRATSDEQAINGQEATINHQPPTSNLQLPEPGARRRLQTHHVPITRAHHNPHPHLRTIPSPSPAPPSPPRLRRRHKQQQQAPHSSRHANQQNPPNHSHRNREHNHARNPIQDRAADYDLL
ncbi:hypothetical protein BZA77DRAFT_304457 [Pyronema omphalodes]|nr:hypothetical protein BZA77DRAFT_304457 [Pyronema omphalodes]